MYSLCGGNNDSQPVNTPGFFVNHSRAKATKHPKTDASAKLTNTHAVNIYKQFIYLLGVSTL
jgi:hypothetical protein